MKRIINHELMSWAKSNNHKPIIIRGARQVGKTHAVVELGKAFSNFVTINFEKQPKACDIFSDSLDPKIMIRDIELLTGQKIIPGKTLLFLDEAQEVPRSLIALRYFYEECPELHVIAAGSLLDFAIEQVGVPVGRVSFIYMHPMSFIEYLVATGDAMLAKAIINEPFPESFSEVIHNKALKCVAEYMAIGGMPEAVKCWQETNDIDQVSYVHQSIINSYRQDFEKYCKTNQIKYASLLFDNVARQLAKVFKYSDVPSEYRKRDLAPCLELLFKAMVAKPIYYTSAQGVPLGAQTNFNYFKTILVDVALTQSVLGLHPRDWFLDAENTLVNKGEIAEAFVGQELLAYGEPHIEPRLYYWQRQERASQAEVDYVMSEAQKVLPIEVKSSKGTTLKSLHMFLDSHEKAPYGIRISMHPFSIHEFTENKMLHSYPLYAVAKLFAGKNKWVQHFLSD